MRIAYDKEADALYIELREGSFAANKTVDDQTILDAGGNLLGIELLDASKRIPAESLSAVHAENLPTQ